LITAEKLCKKFGKIDAVKDVSFEIEKGEIVGFLGSNAAGKTTTMRMLTCYFPPTSGTATVAGYDVFEKSLDVRKNVGYLPENVPLYLDMPVDYFLGFVAALKGVPTKERTKRVETAIDRCGLTHVKERSIGTLSKGYRQRVGLAQAIITDPPVLILDEPTVGLDPKQIIEIRNLIKSFGGKSTVILSTHILHEIEKVCDRILIINKGEILAFDTIDNLSDKLSECYTLNLTVDGETEKIKQTLKDIPVVSKLQDLGKTDDDLFRYKMTIPKNPEARTAISTKLLENDLKLVEMYIERMSAEDIFRLMVPDREESPAGEDAEADSQTAAGTEPEVNDEIEETEITENNDNDDTTPEKEADR
jgi:ABC-2 type transport system ATP-binding protein